MVIEIFILDPLNMKITFRYEPEYDFDMLKQPFVPLGFMIIYQTEREYKPVKYCQFSSGWMLGTHNLAGVSKQEEGRGAQQGSLL